ncbi:Protein S100-A8 [Heterocephalus glaber]|uniref:Protein S100-A8 n=1 Tax=Heterocephalus glaber TaxID=10181 RepID=G5BIG3_HETGA|nr:protein S100-A8-like [Heterocephalus glaber]EHB09074.1 Protein S100-A8 [Heterocephalus glaber]
METEMEKALNQVIEVYHKYSLAQGNPHALYKSDLKKLLTTECPQYTKKKTATAWFKQFDINEDGAVNFQEFLPLVMKVSLRAHEESHKH